MIFIRVSLTTSLILVIFFLPFDKMSSMNTASIEKAEKADATKDDSATKSEPRACVQNGSTQMFNNQLNTEVNRSAAGIPTLEAITTTKQNNESDSAVPTSSKTMDNDESRQERPLAPSSLTTPKNSNTNKSDN